MSTWPLLIRPEESRYLKSKCCTYFILLLLNVRGINYDCNCSIKHSQRCDTQLCSPPPPPRISQLTVPQLRVWAQSRKCVRLWSPCGSRTSPADWRCRHISGTWLCHRGPLPELSALEGRSPMVCCPAWVTMSERRGYYSNNFDLPPG